MNVVVASWIVTVEEDRRAAARDLLARLPGVIVAPRPGPLVVTTECGEGDLGRVHRELEAVPGVLTVAMVTAYKDEEGSA